MEQKIEGNGLELNLLIKGEKAKIFVDKIIYSQKSLTFFLSEKETLRITLSKDYKTIYEALKSAGIKIEGY